MSCLTAAGVVGVLDQDQFDVVGIGITRSGRWVSVDPEAIAALGITDGRLPELGENSADAVLLRASAGSELAVRQRSALRELGPIDVAISLLHGPFGEDGTIQGLFEMMGTRYVGAGVLASAIGMDKHFMKLVLGASGVPVGPFVPITPAEWARDPAACLEAVAALHYPLFVKPARGGSSLGISRVDEPDGLAAAIELAQRHDPKIIVEEGFVGARELECGVLADLDGGPPRASKVAEIRVAGDGGSTTSRPSTCPTSRSVWTSQPTSTPTPRPRCSGWRSATFEAIGCEGLARVDMFLTADREVVVNEINTMPGFTPHSMFPRMWAASGVAYPELVEQLIRLAQQRPWACGSTDRSGRIAASVGNRAPTSAGGNGETRFSFRQPDERVG